MDRLSLASKARKHWKTWLPQRTAELKKEGAFEEAVQGAALAAIKMIQELMSQGYQAHEAEEVALRQFVLLPPENGANEADWERQELAQMESDYQTNVAPNL